MLIHEEHADRTSRGGRCHAGETLRGQALCSDMDVIEGTSHRHAVWEAVAHDLDTCASFRDANFWVQTMNQYARLVLERKKRTRRISFDRNAHWCGHARLSLLGSDADQTRRRNLASRKAGLVLAKKAPGTAFARNAHRDGHSRSSTFRTRRRPDAEWHAEVDVLKEDSHGAEVSNVS